MSFRTRVLLLVFTVLGLLLAGLGGWARTLLVDELTRAHESRVEAEWTRSKEAMASLDRDLHVRVDAVARHIQNDSSFRLALLGRTPAEKRAMVDYAGQIWPLTGLDFLEVLSDDGRVLSSAHYRESFGAVRNRARGLLTAEPMRARIPTPGGSPALAWAHGVRFGIGGTNYLVWGGLRGDSLGLHGPAAATERVSPYGVEWAQLDLVSGEIERKVAWMPVPDDELARAERSLDRTILFALVAGVLAALVLSWIVARWIERPVTELIDKTLRVRVGREDVTFDTGRSDELGELGRFIGSMVRRLRDSADSLREAERRATLGDVARQVHHDVKNGVVPLRGVMRHLEEVAEHQPEQLALVFRERAGTLESGLEYLERLSTHYARLTQRAPLESVDVRGLVAEMTRSWSHAYPQVRIEVILAPDLPPAQAEALGLRRVLDNLGRNAIEAMASGASGGTGRAQLLRVTAKPLHRRERDWVEIELADNGPGMDEAATARVFEPFFTTKPTGTGLGLSIVRRLVTDFGGRIDVESELGEGTTFRLLLPAWGG